MLVHSDASEPVQSTPCMENMGVRAIFHSSSSQSMAHRVLVEKGELVSRSISPAEGAEQTAGQAAAMP